MNKKFLSAILFGALMVTSTGTFVSCKDYDDDIDSLQTQVDASKADCAAGIQALQGQVAALQSALATAQSTADAAKKAAADAQATGDAAMTAAKAAEAAAAQAKADAIAKAIEEVEALKAWVMQGYVTNEALAEALLPISAKITAIEETLDQITVYITENLEANIQTALKNIMALQEDLAIQQAVLEEYEALMEELKAGDDELWAELTSTREGLQEAITALNNLLEEETKGLWEEIALARQELSAAITALANIQADDKEELMNEINEILKANKITSETLAAIINTQADDKAELLNEIEQILIENAKLSETLAGLITSHGEDKAALEDSIAELKKALEAKIANLEEKLGSADVTYGEEIAALANEIDLLVQKDLETSNTLATLITMIDDLEAAHAADKAAIEKKIEDLKADLTASITSQIDALNTAILATMDEKLNAVYAEIASLNSTLGEDISKVNNQIQDLQGELATLHLLFDKMITHVSLVKALNEQDPDLNLNLVAAKAVRTWTFGEGMPGAIEFVKDSKETFESSFIIRVSPTNATVDEETLQLINSQNGNLDNLIDIVKVEPYTGLITKAVSPSGLWKVTVKLDEGYSETDYENAAWTYSNGRRDKQILYAVKIGNEERQVVSEYGVTLGSQDRQSLRNLNFNVNANNVATIHNRWNGSTGIAFTEMSGDEVDYKELAWNINKQYHSSIGFPYAQPIAVDNTNNGIDEVNVQADETDARNGLPSLSVKAGETFTVNFTGIAATYTDHIRGFYVTLDNEECAVESAPSEMRAWESYDVEGLNVVSPYTEAIELTIPESAGAEGDYIGFRVFAVNYDGSLVDPDGKAFYVYVGETDTNIANLTLSISNEVVLPLERGTTSTKDDFSTAKWGRAQGGTYTLKVTEANGTPVTNVVDFTNFKFTYVDGYGATQTVALFQDSQNLIASADITKITTVELVYVMAAALKDNMTYTATITAKNANSGNVAVATIKFTKQLPAFPAAIKPFTGQVVNGNLMVFPYFDGTDAAYDMTSSWHGLSLDVNGVSEVVAEDFYHNVARNEQFEYNSSTNIITTGIAHLNPSANTYLTKWPTKVSYNYGTISQKIVNGAWTVCNHIPVWGQDLTIQFGNYVNECSYSMDTNLKITYPGAIGRTSKFELDKVTIKDWYNAAVSLLDIQDQTADTKEAKYFEPTFRVEFLTGDNFEMVDEYYEFDKIDKETVGTGANAKDVYYVYMTSKSDAATGNPVVTKIRLTFADKFGNEIVKVVDGSFTMNYQE